MTTVLTPTETREGLEPKGLSTVLAVLVVGFAVLADLSRRAGIAAATFRRRGTPLAAADRQVAPRRVCATILGVAVWAIVVTAALIGMTRGLGAG